MKTIFLVIFASFCLYHTGAVKRWLQLFAIPDFKECGPPEEVETVPEMSPRERLELEARYVVQKQGANPDTVIYMSDELLTALIRDYIKETK